MESVEKLRELAADMSANEIIDHISLYPSCVFKGEWLDSWHRAFDKELEALEREITEHYMELPVDADGVPIRCGDMVDGGMGDSGEVQHIEIWPDGFVVVYEVSPGRFTRYAPDAVCHVKPDPVKELLEEFGDWYKHVAGGCDEPGVIDEYADRIREAVGADGN